MNLPNEPQENESQSHETYQQQLEEALKLKQQFEQVEAIVKKYLTNDAIARYGTLKSAYPEKAMRVVSLIAHSISYGNLKQKMNDSQFKQLLLSLEEPKKDFTFIRK